MNAEFFEVAGVTFRVGSEDHENLIREAIRQKVLQNPKVSVALQSSTGSITHRVSRKMEPIFKVERLLMSIREELFGH